MLQRPLIASIVIVGITAASAAVIFGFRHQDGNKDVVPVLNSVVNSKPAGNTATVLASLERRLQAGEKISTPEYGEMVAVRTITFDQPILTGRILIVSGLVGNHDGMYNFSVMATNYSTLEGEGTSGVESINPDGSFSIQVSLSSGPGLYTVSFQAPIIEYHEPFDDDFTYQPAASWVVKVE